MDAIEMLRQDHRKAEELFAIYSSSQTDEAKQRAVDTLCGALKVHMALEEEIFYPEARKLLDDQELIDEAEKEHAEARKVLDSIERREPGFRMDVQVKALEMAITHHVKEEEGELFPLLEDLEMDVVQLGERMHKRKQELMTEL